MKDKLPIYYKCNMTMPQHLLAYVIFGVLLSLMSFVFYHVVWLSLIVGFLMAIPMERIYAKSTIRKRQKALRIQFKDFLASMSVAARAGNVEIKAIKSALEDLKMTYPDDSDIVREVENIILQYERGGIQLKDLFDNFAERSELEDVRNFATIFKAIDGKNDRFGDVVCQTEEIIGQKIETEMEIETVITGAKTETMTMLFMPILVVGAMSVMGKGFMDSLFTTWIPGHLAATVALIIFVISFLIMVKVTDIEA